MLADLRKVPNLITFFRLLSIPVLWVFAFLRQTVFIGIGILVGGLTDVLDGMVARKLNQVSDFGSKFDSITDQLFQLSTIVWILMLMPEIFTENTILSLLALVTYLLSLFIGIIKFKRIANLHLYVSKVSGFFLSVFIVHAFLVGQYNKLLFNVACLGFILSSTETLMLQLICDRVDEHMGSLLFLYLEEEHPIRRFLSSLPLP